MPDHIDLLDEAKKPDASPAIHASYLLMLHENLLRNINNPSLNDTYGQEAVYMAWSSWTGMTFHNLPYIASAVHKDVDESFLRKECQDFIRYAERSPIPAQWSPLHPLFHRSSGATWRKICEHIANIAEENPAYGIPAIGTSVTVPRLPVIPELGAATRFLPKRLKSFLSEYRLVIQKMPQGKFATGKWSRWIPKRED